jgi:hypothetical protein
VDIKTEQPAKPSRGRPRGTFGPRRRQKELVDQLTLALGCGSTVNALEAIWIGKAATLLTIAEKKRREINLRGAKNASELLALAKIESAAVEAVRSLRLPGSGEARVLKELNG